MPAFEHSVSCAQLSGLFECCKQHKIDLNRLIKDTPYTQAHLSNPSCAITWHSFANLVAGIARYIDAETLLNTGRHAWRAYPLSNDTSKSKGKSKGKTKGKTKNNMSRVQYRYLDHFGPHGLCTQQYPFSIKIHQSASAQLTINLSMQPGYQPCIPLFTILAGQMESLPSRLGRKGARVTLNLHKKGATYLVKLPVAKAISACFWRWLSGLLIHLPRIARIRGASLPAVSQQQDEPQDSYQNLNNQYLNSQNINNPTKELIWLLDDAGRVCDVSPSVYAMLGYQGEDCRATAFRDYFPSETRPRIDQLFDELLEGATASLASRLVLDMQMLTKDGRLVWFNLNIRCQWGPGSQESVLCVTTDISQQKQLEQSLREQRINHHRIIDAAPDAMITFDTEHLIIHANPASLGLFGYQFHELLGTDIKTIMPLPLGEPRWRSLYQSVGKQDADRVKCRGIHKDRSILPLEVSCVSYQQGGNYYQTCIIRDLSKTTALEQQLLSAQKLHSLGQASSELAHDFNNLLVAIRGYVDLALATSPDKQLTHLEDIKKAGQMGTDMTRKLLTFSKREAMAPRLIDANELILGIRGMITRLLPANIVVSFHFPTSSAWLSADPTQLEQVLLNLALNARDAMPDGGGLAITLSDGSMQHPNQQATPKRRVLIEVSDTGMGMDEAVQKRIFEPFYTTKPESQGTGLGLAVVRGIIEQHAGTIEVVSQPGEGSRFSIYLPQMKPPAAVARREVASPDTQGRETLLLVEDNHSVREVTRLILVGAGYQVLPFSSGREAVASFKDLADQVDLVLMDVLMPGLGAQDTAAQLCALKPGVKLAFISGYSADSTQTRFVRDAGMPLITKPYGSETLRARVRACLDEEPSAVCNKEPLTRALIVYKE